MYACTFESGQSNPMLKCRLPSSVKNFLLIFLLSDDLVEAKTLLQATHEPGVTGARVPQPQRVSGVVYRDQLPLQISSCICHDG